MRLARKLAPSAACASANTEVEDCDDDEAAAFAEDEENEDEACGACDACGSAAKHRRSWRAKVASASASASAPASASLAAAALAGPRALSQMLTPSRSSTATSAPQADVTTAARAAAEPTSRAWRGEIEDGIIVGLDTGDGSVNIW